MTGDLGSSSFDECDVRHEIGPRVRPEFGGNWLEGSRRGNTLLCLSGGGFRAAAFHLGAVRRLVELNLIPHVTEIRAVSGGAILAAWIAVNLRSAGDWDAIRWEKDIAQPFRAFLEQDARTVPVLVTAPVNWAVPRARIRLLQSKLDQLLRHASVDDLPHSPRFLFLTTDIFQGELLALPHARVSSGWPLSLVVAASACFPPVFGPIYVSDFTGKALALVDGGVWGNIGLSGSSISRAECVLVSDASYLLEPRFKKPLVNHALLKRTLDVALSRGDSVLRHKMWESDNVNARLEVWRMGDTTNIGSFPSYEYDVESTKRIAGIRTDLDSFSSAEIAILENHGYMRACSSLSWLITRVRSDMDDPLSPARSFDRGMMRRLVDLAELNYLPLIQPPHPGMLNPASVKHHLAGSDHRVLKARRLRRAFERR